MPTADTPAPRPPSADTIHVRHLRDACDVIETWIIRVDVDDVEAVLDERDRLLAELDRLRAIERRARTVTEPGGTRHAAYARVARWILDGLTP